MNKKLNNITDNNLKKHTFESLHNILSKLIHTDSKNLLFTKEIENDIVKYTHLVYDPVDFKPTKYIFTVEKHFIDDTIIPWIYLNMEVIKDINTKEKSSIEDYLINFTSYFEKAIPVTIDLYEFIISLNNSNVQINIEKFHKYIEEILNLKVIFKKGKYNIIKSNGCYLSDIWFDGIKDMLDSYGCWLVEKNVYCNKYKETFTTGNFLRPDGTFVFDDWFFFPHIFENGKVIIYIENEGYYILNHDFSYLFDKPIIDTDPFRIINKDKECITFNGCVWWMLMENDELVIADEYHIESDGTDAPQPIMKGNAPNTKWNYTKKNGQLLSKEWFDYTEHFDDCIGRVKKNGKWNYINKQGNLLSDVWFDENYSFTCGVGMVLRDNKYNYINKNGNFISDKWFKKAYLFRNDYAVIETEKGQNHIDVNGNLVSNHWYEYASGFNCDGIAWVSFKNRKYHNFINKYGKIILNNCLGTIYKYDDENSPRWIKINDNVYRINEHGDLIHYIVKKQYKHIVACTR